MEKELKPGKFLKQHMQDEYAKEFKESSYLFVTDFGGLKNKELEALRKKLKPLSSGYIIVKNSLCRLALKGLKIDGLVDMVTGACAFGLGKGDPISVSKLLVNFAKEHKNLKLKGAYIDSKVVSLDTIQQLAAIPSREVLLTRLVSCLNSPVSGFVSVCSGVIRKFVYALNEVSKKKQG